jgi:hypothetical protein
MADNIWIAFIHVKPLSPKSVLSSGAKGAYANAMALANDRRGFEDKIRKGVLDYGLELVDLEDVETFAERVESQDVSSELLAIAESIESPERVYFDAFYNYFSDDEVQ